MKNGTILEFIEEQDDRRANVHQLVRFFLRFRICIFPTTCQLLETAEGMEYLHSQDIVHGDLKGVCGASDALNTTQTIEIEGQYSHRR
jgi:serine/threonine protein kinase